MNEINIKKGRVLPRHWIKGQLNTGLGITQNAHSRFKVKSPEPIYNQITTEQLNCL